MPLLVLSVAGLLNGLRGVALPGRACSRAEALFLTWVMTRPPTSDGTYATYYTMEVGAGGSSSPPRPSAVATGDPAAVAASLDWGQRAQLYLASAGQVGHALTLGFAAVAVSPFSKERAVLAGPLVHTLLTTLQMPLCLCQTKGDRPRTYGCFMALQGVVGVLQFVILAVLVTDIFDYEMHLTAVGG